MTGTATGPATTDEVGDGRRRRRDRNRDAVVDALLSLYDEGILDPRSRQIAERAGLSPRSLFRYFDDVDDLCRAAVARQIGRLTDLVAPSLDPTSPLPDRIERFVQERMTIADASAHVGVAARIRAPFQPAIATELRAGRQLLRARAATLFAPELDHGGLDRLRVIDVLCSFEAIQLLRIDQRLDRETTARALVSALTALLAPEVHP